MTIYFDDGGPQIQLKERNPQEVKAMGQRAAKHDIAAGAAQALVLAIIALCIAVLAAPGSTLLHQILAGTGLLLGIAAVALSFIQQWHRSSAEEANFLNQQIRLKDQAAIKKLVGEEIVLTPPTTNGYGKLRVFYRDSNGMLRVWYSDGSYRYQQSKGEASINFETGVVMIPNFVRIPGYLIK